MDSSLVFVFFEQTKFPKNFVHRPKTTVLPENIYLTSLLFVSINVHRQTKNDTIINF